MAIKVKKTGAWVTIPNGGLFVKSGGVWVSPRKVWVKRSGAWVDTGFTGRPNTPTLGIYSDDYTHIQVSAASPTSGTPSANMRFALYNSGGGLLQGPFDQACGPGGVVYRDFTGLSTDTSYIIRAWTISAAGVLSVVTPDLRRHTGHPEQGYNQANYGWSGEIFAHPAQIDGTSAHENGMHPGALAVDNDSSTMWVSGPNADPAAFAALVFQTYGGNRLLTRIVMVTMQGGNAENPNSVYSPNQTAYCGIWINGTLTYNQAVGAGFQKTWWLEGYGYNLTNVTQFNISMTNLVPWPLSYRAEIAEVWYYYKDWVIVSYTWIVTVSAAGNSYW